MTNRWFWCRAVAALAGASWVWGCSPARSHDWYGYYYDNVLASAAPHLSPPYPSADACLAAMRDLSRHAPPSASYACARGCPAAQDGYFTDCKDVVR